MTEPELPERTTAAPAVPAVVLGPLAPAGAAPPGTAAGMRAPLVAGALAGGLYAALAPRAIGPGDSAEFTLALALAGVPHPSGYPWYTLAGHLFVRAAHRIGSDWGLAANLWSALGGAVAVALFVALAIRLSAPGRAAGVAVVAGSVLFATHPVWLDTATLAEVHSWGVASVLALGLAALVSLHRLESVPASAPAPWPMGVVWGGLCGVALAHQLTSTAFVVPLSVSLAAAALRRRVLRAPHVLLAAAAAMVPLAGYGWIAWRAAHPAPYQWPLLGPGFPALVDHVRGTVFARAYIGGFAPSAAERAMITHDLLPFLLAAPVGLLAAWHGAGAALRAWIAAVLAGGALMLGFTLRYAVPDPSSYMLPVLAFGLLALPMLAGRAAWLGAAPVRAGLLLLAAGLALAWLPGAVSDRRKVEAEAHAIREAWLALPEPRAILLWDEDRYAELRLHQILRGEHPGVTVDNPSSLSWERPRRAFERRTGIDPLAGLDLSEPGDVRWIPLNIQRQTDRPVLLFAPRRP